jgi:large subunit ribosomal protein L4
MCLFAFAFAHLLAAGSARGVQTSSHDIEGVSRNVIDYQQAVHDVHGIEASPLGVDPSKTLATLLWGFTPAVGVPVARGGLAEKVESRRSPEPLMAVMSNKIPEQIESLIKSRRSCEPLMNVMANKVPVKDIDGNVVGEKEVRLKVAKHAEYCVHRKVVAELANRRQGTASAKTRAEVRGGGRKPYAQKGSGNARRGSSRSPLIVGGGRSFGPRPRSYKQKINKKEGQVAISSALMGATERIQVVPDLDSSNFPAPKTKDFVSFLRRLDAADQTGGKGHVLIVDAGRNENVVLSARNIPYVKVTSCRTLSVFDILKAKKIIVMEGGMDYIDGHYGMSGKKAP